MINGENTISSIPVPLNKIESELRVFWRASAQDENNAVMRAATMTLIILNKDKQQYNQSMQHIAEIADHHPGRIILTVIDEEMETDELKATFSAFCQPGPEKGKQICCEVITLISGQTGLQHLPGALLPLTLADLPIFLFDQIKTSEIDEIFKRFYKITDHIIVNLPERFNTLGEFSQEIKSLLQLAPISHVSELNWGRLTIWREALAQFFDSDVNFELMNNISHIDIETDSEYSFAAFLVMAWLVAQLGWDFDKKMNSGFSFKNHQGNFVGVTLHSSNTGAMQKITIKTGDTILSSKSTLTGIENRIEKNSNTISITHINKPAMEFPQLLCNELDFLQKDTIFERTLTMVNNLLKG